MRVKKEKMIALINELPNWKEALSSEAAYIVEQWIGGKPMKTIASELGISLGKVSYTIVGDYHGKGSAYRKLISLRIASSKEAC